MKLVAIETVKKRFFSDTHRTDSSDIVKHKSSVSLSTLSRYMQVLKVPMWECSYHQPIKITARTYPITKVTKLPADITTISAMPKSADNTTNAAIKLIPAKSTPMQMSMDMLNWISHHEENPTCREVVEEMETLATMTRYQHNI